MNRTTFSLEIFGDRFPVADVFERESNSHKLSVMKKALVKAINSELTDRQKQMVTEYYFEGTSVTEIAKKHGLSKSTVSILNLRYMLGAFSPLIKTNGKNKNNKKTLEHFTEEQKKIINKYSKSNLLQKYKIKKEVNEVLSQNLYETFGDEFINFINSKDVMKFSSFFELNIQKFIKNYRKFRLFYTPEGKKRGFLHNIYYQNISSSYKKALNALKNVDLSIDYNIDDARKVIIKDNKHYHLIFLDAFTPTKCPCLWSLDFFKLLYERLDDNGRILTYSNSAQIRNAFLSAGFYVGKIYNQRTKTYTGTIAVKNSDFIKHQLSEYDLSLMKTRAGIFYRDKNLNALNEAIVERHKKEVENSPLISSSRFIKQYRKEHDNV